MAVSVGSLQRLADSATSRALLGSSSGKSPPLSRGQKKRSWRSAAAWKVRTCTPSTPRVRRRDRISPAARVVKVTASVRRGSC